MFEPSINPLFNVCAAVHVFGLAVFKPNVRIVPTDDLVREGKTRVVVSVPLPPV